MKHRRGARDATLSVLLFAGTILYLALFPLHLGAPDEPKQLHEAKRLLGGEAMYRDIFDLILPGWMVLMSVVFRLFGTTLAVARTTVAVIHGATAALLFRACRRLDVRPALACGAALVYLAVCQPIAPIASQHWLATALSVLLLVLYLEPERPRWRSLAAGIVLGLLISVHQQRGISMALGTGVFLVGEALFARRRGEAGSGTELRRQLAALAGGAALVLVPLFVWILARAGFEPVWRAVVVYSMQNYRTVVRCRWGQGAATVLLRVLALLPLGLALTFSRLAVPALRPAVAEHGRGLAALTVFTLAAISSISYYPDYVHIALIAPFFFAVVAEGAEWVLRLLPARAGAAVGMAAGLAILVACGVSLTTNLASKRALRTVRYASAFGPVDVPSNTALFCQEMDALLRDVPSRTLYVHPNGGYFYLLLDARNPTRFAFILSGYHGPEEKQEVIDTLSAERPPYIVTLQALIAPGDPIARFIEERYEPLSAKVRLGALIWRLRASALGGRAEPESPQR